MCQIEILNETMEVPDSIGVSFSGWTISAKVIALAFCYVDRSKRNSVSLYTN